MLLNKRDIADFEMYLVKRFSMSFTYFSHWKISKKSTFPPEGDGIIMKSNQAYGRPHAVRCALMLMLLLYPTD